MAERLQHAVRLDPYIDGTHTASHSTARYQNSRLDPVMQRSKMKILEHTQYRARIPANRRHGYRLAQRIFPTELPDSFLVHQIAVRYF